MFSLCTDGSNDNADKFYPVILQYLNSPGMPQTSLLSVPMVKEVSATGRNIYNTLNSELEKHGLAWRNCLALGADIAPVMSGNNTGLFGCIKEEQPNLYFAGCPCHLMHLGAKKGAAALGLKLEDALSAYGMFSNFADQFDKIIKSQSSEPTFKYTPYSTLTPVFSYMSCGLVSSRQTLLTNITSVTSATNNLLANIVQ